ncbi:MAG TPA: hypothetical protein ENN90_02145 [Mariniphaga anaerophila]|uniref:Por secretion system C-terminal sorting domain-containing protein n=1 Tax=Mariniphaga anaerophila TaxID=1484053 RepID=A0A831L9A4_9BACT|nr:hypothetical protein [Mariniphaga anaerophila]
MKTMKTTMIAAAMLFMANFAYASGNVRTNMAPTTDESAYVEITNATYTQFEIDVKDQYGDVIFSKKTTEPVTNYKRKYDFSGLDDGTYTLMVKSETEKNETQFKIERGGITVISERKTLEPLFKFDNNIWKMSYLNFPMEKMGLYIYDRSNNLIYEKSLNTEFAVHEGLDLSKLRPGEYEIVFATGFDIFEQTVRIK